MKRIIFIFLFLALSLYPHRVDIFPYVEGNKFIVEGYFSDGTPAKNCKVEIYRGEKKIAEGKTDSEGIAEFPVDKIKGNIKVVLLAGMGHRAETTYSMEDKEEKYSDEEIGKKIEISVEKAIKPLIKMMEEEKRRAKFSEIVGGIGYILGIFGIISLLYRKRK